MAVQYGKGVFSNRSKAFIIGWTFLHNVTVYFGGYLIYIYYQKTKEDITESSFALWIPEYWLTAGCVLGGLSALIIGRKWGTKILLLLIRFIQILAIIVILSFYVLSKYAWVEEYWVFGLYSTFMLQGFIDCLSQISSPIYVMETICDREPQLSVTLLLLVSTQLPLYMSSFVAVLLSEHHLFLTLGVGIFAGIFLIVIFFFMFLPKSSQDGTVCDKDDNATFWHLQFEKESGWVCPATTSLALCLLSQMTGFQMYEFYASWSIRLLNIPLDTGIMKSGVIFVTVLLTLPFWTRNRLSIFLITTTGIISICLFLSGIILHGLEAGNPVYPIVPFLVNTVFAISYTAGLLTLTPIVCLILIPRRYRLAIFSIVTTITILDRRLVRAVTPTFIELLHPFGVFWLHAGATSLGLLYMVVAIVDQVKDRHRSIPSSQCTVEEFITQV
ncbi:unnamed protein product [Nezara viridula]|uniref:Uncharacterized protein n=1 Tax=Nezara viridula TaxID=85310 RepID=A0A9P0ED92_NEZVI|nr:unnamed protein product [Nezara viridula]